MQLFPWNAPFPWAYSRSRRSTTENSTQPKQSVSFKQRHFERQPHTAGWRPFCPAFRSEALEQHQQKVPTVPLEINDHHLSKNREASIQIPPVTRCLLLSVLLHRQMHVKKYQPPRKCCTQSAPFKTAIIEPPVWGKGWDGQFSCCSFCSRQQRCKGWIASGTSPEPFKDSF